MKEHFIKGGDEHNIIKVIYNPDNEKRARFFIIRQDKKDGR